MCCGVGGRRVIQLPPSRQRGEEGCEIPFPSASITWQQTQWKSWVGGAEENLTIGTVNVERLPVTMPAMSRSNPSQRMDCARYFPPYNATMAFVTADLIDAFGAELQSCDVQFRQFGAKRAFHGPVRTIKTLEDNALIKQLLGTPGNGAVLVVDGGGSLKTALMGDLIAASALKNSWMGMIFLGAVRDVVALGKMDLGIKALGSNPCKSSKAGAGIIDVPVTFGAVTFTPGNWLYSDDDGIVVAARQLPH